MHYILGLGNPGDQYKNTPHNVGRDLCLWLIENWAGCSSSYFDKSNSLIVHHCGDYDFLLPNTYMNLSGNSLSGLLSSDPEFSSRLIVIHDDIDLPLGYFKITHSGGSGGHKGIDSVRLALGNDDFIRFKIGVSPVDTEGNIKKPVGRENVSSYVLSKMSKSELSRVKSITPRVAEAISSVAESGVAKTMSIHNDRSDKFKQ